MCERTAPDVDSSGQLTTTYGKNAAEEGDDGEEGEGGAERETVRKGTRAKGLLPREEEEGAASVLTSPIKRLKDVRDVPLRDGTRSTSKPHNAKKRWEGGVGRGEESVEGGGGDRDTL